MIVGHRKKGEGENNINILWESNKSEESVLDHTDRVLKKHVIFMDNRLKDDWLWFSDNY